MGGWNRLNQFKSIALFDKIQKRQEQEKQHVKLCAQLCAFQTKRKRQFHLEQPLGSAMPQLDEFQEIHRMTRQSKFDMCAFGLRHPMSKNFLKKSSQVFTTDSRLLQCLNSKRCDHQHVHQPIEGSVLIDQHRVALTQFCATYCKGFVTCIARWLVKLSLGEDACVGEHDDEPPSKRSRFEFNPHKRFKSTHPIDLDPEDPKPLDANMPQNPNTSSSSNSKNPEQPFETESRKFPEISPPSVPVNRPEIPSAKPVSPWDPVFQECDKIAPRVGNLKVEPSHVVFRQVQERLPKLEIRMMFVCRGTERLQIPMGIGEPQQNAIRYTVCVHRTTGAIHEFGPEEWTKLKRSQRIRSAVPSKLMISCFGRSCETVPEPEPNAVAPRKPDDEAHQLPQSSEIPNSGPAETDSMPARIEMSKCEGWAPPPIAIHGPKYRQLTNHEKQDLRKLHVNLGHPAPKTLSEHLKNQGAAPHIVEAARDFVCDTCVESTGPRAHRPAKLHSPKDFNDLLGIDGFYWAGIRGFQVHVYHCIDEASLFHLGCRCETRNTDEVITAWSNLWTTWAGNPNKIYTDPAGEFISNQWKDTLMSRSIEPVITTEAWHRGRVERHGQILKRMISRFDLEKPIESVEEFDQVLRACCQAKNALVRHEGYSPEQIVLGKSAKIPSSLTSDENMTSHAMADGEGPESDAFRNALEIRTIAKKAFHLSDNDQAIRRALLRKSCPNPSPYQPGQMVMFWTKKANPGRRETGRWYGPAKVVFQETPSAVWITYAERMFKRATESLRPVSMREWQMSSEGGTKWYSNLPDPDLEDKRTASAPIEYEPSIAPATPNAQLPDFPLTPISTSQPESEHVPEPNTENTNPEPPSNPPENNPPINDEPIDLDSEDLDLQIPEEPQTVLHCTTVDEPNSSHDGLFEWITAQPGEQPCDILLAEDGLPYLENPLTCEEQQCFHMEILLNENDINQWIQSDKPEELAVLASVSKRARAEINVKNLTLDEKILFEKAKDAELNCWLQTSALKPVLRRHLNPEQILKSRWILTWKAIDEENSQQPQRKAKARLVVLGFQDPKLTEVARDSPTLTREGRHTILQTIASRAWELTSFDIKTAFLRGQADRSNPLAMEPPIELRKKMNLSDNQVCAL